MIILVDPTSISDAGNKADSVQACNEEPSFGKRVSALFVQVFWRSIWLLVRRFQQ
ncbi:MAG: hypothetical protein WB760_23560 [Xanthobacteraceae bacterium]